MDNGTRCDALLDTIDHFKTLPEDQQDELKWLYDETIERFKKQERVSRTIHGFLRENSVDLTFTKNSLN